MRKWLIIISLIAASPYISMAQNSDFDASDIISEILTNAVESDNEDDLAIAQMSSEYLENLVQRKVNINTDNISQLQGIPFVTDTHIDELMRYRRRYGDLKSMGELKAIDMFNNAGSQKYLRYFINLDASEAEEQKYTLAEMLTQGKHSITTTTKTILEQQEAYIPDSTGHTEYEGCPVAWCVKYRYNFRNRIAWGITTEKDAGEAIDFGRKKYGFDFNSVYLKFENFGHLERVILGDYTARFGQGLILGGGFSMGKFVTDANYSNFENQIHEYGSCNETAYYRGAAATARYSSLRITALASINLTDGRMDDSTFHAIRTDGLHRTSHELSNKDNLRETNMALMANYSIKRLKLGACAHYYSFDKQYIPQTNLRDQILRQDQHGLDYSVSYRYSTRMMSLYGETALDKDNNLATINILDITPIELMKISILQRNYSSKYLAFRSSTFSQNSRTGNERGIYIGTALQPASWLYLEAWADIYRFPWATTASYMPSGGVEQLAQATIKTSQNNKIQIKIKQRRRQNSETDYTTTRYLKASNTYTPIQGLQLCTTLQWSGYKEGGTTERGYLIYQNARVSRGRHMAAARVALFSAPYNARIYSYENDVAYFFSVPGYYYTGARYYLVAGTKIMGKANIQVRISQWHYFNKQKISSGAAEIEGSRKSELNVYFKYSI